MRATVTCFRFPDMPDILATEALSEALTGPLLSNTSEQSKICRKQVVRVLEVLSTMEFVEFKATFNHETLLILNRACQTSLRSHRSKLINKEKLWTEFHRLSLFQMKDVWNSFLSKISCPLDPLIQQFVNKKCMTR